MTKQTKSQADAIALDCSGAGWTVTYKKMERQPVKPSRVLPKSSLFGRIDRGLGWRVCWSENGYEYLVPMVFARKRDAERAAAAVNELRDWGPTWEDAVEQIYEFGRAEFRKALTECLAW